MHYFIHIPPEIHINIFGNFGIKGSSLNVKLNSVGLNNVLLMFVNVVKEVKTRYVGFFFSKRETGQKFHMVFVIAGGWCSFGHIGFSWVQCLKSLSLFEHRFDSSVCVRVEGCVSDLQKCVLFQ